ncbi:SiaC family regulatory phosphoprotein [Crocinitomix catalasitica]|nr:SiaC family regulatory phosphoprotein [Crocinitomix catalasitica]
MEEQFSYGYENVNIEGTEKSPSIILNKDKGIIEIRGKSIPENTREFYYPFNRWLTEYSYAPALQTEVTVALQYMNSSSSVVITRLIKLLDDMIGLKSGVVNCTDI